MGLVRRLALQDAAALLEGGFGALMVENYHDIPFHSGRAPAETVAAMAVVIGALAVEFPRVPLGVNVLRNDVASALAIAAATGAGFVRVNVHTGAAVTDQGTIEGQAWHTLRLRRQLQAEKVAILADLRVKHARPLAERPLAEEAQDLRLRGLADAVIITGAATGSGASPEELAQARAALPDCPLLVGSGLAVGNLGDFFPVADACIVGSSLKLVDPESGLPMVSSAKAAAFISALGSVRAESA